MQDVVALTGYAKTTVNNWCNRGQLKSFRKGQLFSAAAYSLGHGGNDAQKTMGIISMLLLGGLAGQEAAPIRDFLLTHE